jgi:hypothetical protein
LYTQNPGENGSDKVAALELRCPENGREDLIVENGAAVPSSI